MYIKYDNLDICRTKKLKKISSYNHWLHYVFMFPENLISTFYNFSSCQKCPSVHFL